MSREVASHAPLALKSRSRCTHSAVGAAACHFSGHSEDSREREEPRLKSSQPTASSNCVWLTNAWAPPRAQNQPPDGPSSTSPALLSPPRHARQRRDTPLARPCLVRSRLLRTRTRPSRPPHSAAASAHEVDLQSLAHAERSRRTGQACPLFCRSTPTARTARLPAAQARLRAQARPTHAR